ncbi:hypothetical protein G9A89_003269 [Geosiphon pyriformis]|nr:hypothetical protein G9A89_003269 [Geosiphon pyriformis]
MSDSSLLEVEQEQYIVEKTQEVLEAYAKAGKAFKLASKTLKNASQKVKELRKLLPKDMCIQIPTDLSNNFTSSTLDWQREFFVKSFYEQDKNQEKRKRSQSPTVTISSSSEHEDLEDEFMQIVESSQSAYDIQQGVDLSETEDEISLQSSSDFDVRSGRKNQNFLLETEFPARFDRKTKKSHMATAIDMKKMQDTISPVRSGAMDSSSHKEFLGPANQKPHSTPMNSSSHGRSINRSQHNHMPPPIYSFWDTMGQINKCQKVSNSLTKRSSSTFHRLSKSEDFTSKSKDRFEPYQKEQNQKHNNNQRNSNDFQFTFPHYPHNIFHQYNSDSSIAQAPKSSNSGEASDKSNNGQGPTLQSFFLNGLPHQTTSASKWWNDVTKSTYSPQPLTMEENALTDDFIKYAGPRLKNPKCTQAQIASEIIALSNNTCKMSQGSVSTMMRRISVPKPQRTRTAIRKWLEYEKRRQEKPQQSF